MVNQTERYFLYDSALYGKDISRKLNGVEEKCYFSRSPAQNNEQAKVAGDCAHMKLISYFE